MRTVKKFPLHMVVAGALLMATFVPMPVSASTSRYVGTYSSEPPAESPEGVTPEAPSFSVSLGPDGSATVMQDLGKGAGTVTSFGHWSDSGGQIVIKFDPSPDGKPADPPMIFNQSHDGLQAVTWNRTLWGKVTPPPLKKEESNWHANKKHGLL